MNDIFLNPRLDLYKKLISSYDLFVIGDYEASSNIITSILEDIDDIINKEFYTINWHTRRTQYSRPIRKNKQSMKKQFIEWLHKSIFNISKHSLTEAYIYIKDMRTILNNLS